MGYNRLKRKCELEEFGLDFSTEENIEKDPPKLILVNEISHLGENLSSAPIPTDDEGGELSEESGEDLYYDSQSGVCSPLVIYFKTINRFPLLTEEEEITLVKRIKESEVKCKHLVIQWKHLFKNEFLGIFPAKQVKEISKKLQLLNGSFHLFDDLVKLERERKEVKRVLQKRANSFKTQEELQGGLYKVEANISKCIAKISLSKTIINGIIRNLKGIPHSKKYTKKRKCVEQELKKLIREAGKVSNEIKESKNELIQANQRLVISIAKRYSHHGLALPDLIQEGNLGLIRAIDTYDYRRGYRFTTYATWWIRQTIIRALDCKSRTVRTPVYTSEKLRKIVKVSNRLLQECKREPTLEEIAEETNTSLESIEKVVQSFKDPISMDALIEGGYERVITPSLNHGTTSILDQVISSNLSQIIDVILSGLTLREKEVVKLRFGIGKSRDHKLDEIGERYDLSRERIRQILETALNKLRNPKRMMKLKDFKDFN